MVLIFSIAIDLNWIVIEWPLVGLFYIPIQSEWDTERENFNSRKALTSKGW